MVRLLGDNLTAGVIDDAHNRVDVLSRMLAEGTLRTDLPVSDDDEEVVQVYDAAGTVLAYSANARGLGPLVRPGHPENQPIDNPVGEDPLVVVTATRDTPAGPRTILDARSLGTVNDTVLDVTEELAIGVPLLLLVMGATSWVLVGWALAPVEALRREVDEISSAELHRRVVDAPGGDEFARLSRTMNRMLERLEQAQHRQRRLVSDASHELRSPVAGVRQQAEVALAHPDRTDGAQFAQPVLAESIRLHQLIDDLLLLARADEKVWFALGYRGDRVVLTVDDDGDGIPVPERLRVLERFVRLDEGRARDAGGSGLGLAIVRELVVAHGGEVRIEDGPQGGARIRLSLPASTDPGDQPGPEEDRPEQAAPGNAAPGNAAPAVSADSRPE